MKKGKKGGTGKLPIKINKVNIINGEVVYNTSKLYVNLLKFDLFSFPRENVTIYRLTSPHLRIVFPLSGKRVTVEGQMISEFREQRSSWKISKFYWETEYATINVNGKIYKEGAISLNAYTQGSIRQILDPILKKRSIREFMYSNAKIKKIKRGRLSITGEFNYNTFTFNGEAFKNLKGTARWDNKTKRLHIDTSFDSGTLKTKVKLDKKGKPVRITAENIQAGKIAKIVDIYDTVPLDGVIKKGTVDINGKVFSGTVDLAQNPEYNNSTELNVGGSIDFTYNSKKKSVLFYSTKLRSEFGQLTFLKGSVTPKKQTKLSLQVKSTVDNTVFLDKYTRFYISLPLNQWKLKGGRGSIDLDVKKIDKTFFIESDIHLQDFYSGKEKIQSLKGHVSSKGNDTRGKFHILDRDLKGEAEFSRKNKESDLRIHFNNINGQSKKILSILDLDLALFGPVKGNFVYTNKRGMTFPLVEGTFQTPKVNFYGFDFENLSGDLVYSDSVSVKNLDYQYMNGSGHAEVFIDFPKKRFHIAGKVTGVDIHRMNNEFKGKGDLSFKGKGAFDKDPIAFNYLSEEIFFYKDQSFSVKGEGKILTDFSSFRLETVGNVLSKKLASPFTLKLNQSEGQYSGDFHVDVKDINLLIPWGNNNGEVNVDGLITGSSEGRISMEGHAAFKGKVLSFPNFPHALKNFSGDLTFHDLAFRLRSLHGFMGGGAVESNGYLNIKNNRLNVLSINFTGKKMTLYPMDRATFTLNADLTLKYIKKRNKLLLSGDLDILSCLWEREIDEGISFNTNPSLSASGSTIMDMLEYDLKMVGKENARFNNSFGQAIGKFNLGLTGNTDFPILLGVIETRDGTVNFSGKKFDLVRGKLTFNKKFHNDPVINFESEAFIKNYRIKFAISGSASRPKPELQSSPPLPPRDILTLISVGELFRKPTSAELNSQLGVGTTGLIAAELTEQIKKRTKKIFGNYMLRIAPNISNITGAPADTSLLIVGKEIAKDFLIVYSTDFSTQRQQVVYLQYQLSPSISIIGMRNEEGRLSIDLRLRKRH